MGVSLASLPTWLTITRLICAPLVAGLILWADASIFTLGAPLAALIYALALGLFVLAAITDAADGILARRLQATSVFGAALDHAADKALTTSALIALASVVLPTDLVIAAIALIVRDMVIAGVREGLALGGRALPVSSGGKLKTATLLLAIGALMLFQILALGGQAPLAALDLLAQVARAALWISVALSLWSGWAYLRRPAATPPAAQTTP